MPSRAALSSGEDLIIAPTLRTEVMLISLNTAAPARMISDVMEVLADQPDPLLLCADAAHTVLRVTHLNGATVGQIPWDSSETPRVVDSGWLALGRILHRLPLLDESVRVPAELEDAEILAMQICGERGAERLCVALTVVAPGEGAQGVQLWELRSHTLLMFVPHVATDGWRWHLFAAMDMALCVDEDGCPSIYSLSSGELLGEATACSVASAECSDRYWIHQRDGVLVCYTKGKAALALTDARGACLHGDVLCSYQSAADRATVQWTLRHLPSDACAHLALPAGERVREALSVLGGFVALSQAVDNAMRQPHSWRVYYVEVAPPHARRLLGEGPRDGSAPCLLRSPDPLRPPLLFCGSGGSDARQVPLPRLPTSMSVLEGHPAPAFAWE